MKKVNVTEEQVLNYHLGGKINVVPSKPLKTIVDLSCAYTPGVAIPCKKIEKNPELAYKYTSKRNLVAVISNGTAVLGLGNIGALAGKPVMEGKAVLFKNFGGIDAVDVLVNEEDPEKCVNIIHAISQTYGGINLEDFKAPECFQIEQKLKSICDIPIMHDDQHGTAIITSAALINACKIQGKKPEDLNVVIIGAGAAGIASGKLWKYIGCKNILMCDRKGVISKNRSGLTKEKEEFAVETEKKTIADALNGADVLLGLSGPGIVTKEMIKTMAPNSLVFALANPTPEILPEEVKEVREDIIVATGRSDYPNQINNVLGFPFIFRGALDIGAREINEEMKVAAVHALSELAQQPIPDSIKELLGKPDLEFGKDYLIPSPFDPRLKNFVSKRVAEAAIKTKVNRFDVDIESLYEI